MPFILNAAEAAPAASHSLPMLLLRLREITLLQLRPVIRAFELTEQQARVLVVLSEAGALEMMVLAETCCIAPPSLSRIIPRLLGRGLVEVERREQDQRRVLVTLSPQGSQVTSELRGALRRAHGETKHRIGDQQVQVIIGNVQDAIVALGSPSLVATPSAVADGHDTGEEE